MLYMKLWCNGFPEISGQLEEGHGVNLPQVMCIVLYMKLIWCNSFPEIYASRSARFGVVVFKASMLD